MTKCNETSTKNYHHGNLRNSLILAAAELIKEHGVDGFAMIDAARRAGVSSAAPYRHFDDKNALLVAVADLGFVELIKRLDVVKADQEEGSVALIVALGKTYMNFVIAHGAYFELMWTDHLKLGDQESSSQVARSTGLTVLVTAVSAWCLAQKLTNADSTDITIKLWALAQGLSSLSMNNLIEKEGHEYDIQEMLESSTLTFLNGVKDNG